MYSCMNELDDFRKRVDDFKRRLKEDFERSLKRYEDALDELEKRVETLPEDKLRDVYPTVRELRRGLMSELYGLHREFRRMVYDLRRKLRRLALRLPEDYGEMVDEVKRALIEARDELEGYRDSASALAKKLRNLELRVRERLGRSAGLPVEVEPLEKGFDRLIVGIEEVLGEILSSAGRILSKTSEVISSVRIPESDARIIRLLVDAGIFRSRNDALAFFVHKGIEASRDWLERVQDRLEKIRELQEEMRRELEKIFHSEEESPKD